MNNFDILKDESFPLYHGSEYPFKVGKIVEPRNGQAWATYSKNVAGAHGFRVFKVEHINNSGNKEVSSVLGFRVIAEYSNPHDTGECGVKECEYGDDHGVKINNGMELDQ